jgi:PAS domain S-box-containing protein
MPPRRPSHLDLGLLFEQLPDAALVADLGRNQIVFWNAPAEHLFGYPAAEILGQPVERLIPAGFPALSPAGSDPIPPPVADPARPAPRIAALQARHKVGREIAVECTLAALASPATGGPYVLAVLRAAPPPHARAGARLQSEEPFRLLVESVQDYAIFMLDPNGIISSWNAGAQRLKGYRADEIIGQHFSRFYPPEDIAAGKPARELAIAVAEGRVVDEGWRVRKDGSHFWANVVITALHDPDGRLRGFANVTRDETARLQAAPNAVDLHSSATTIQRMRIMEDQLTALIAASGSLISELRLDTLLPTVLDLAQRVVTADAYAVWRYRQATDTWQAIATRGLSVAFQQATIHNYRGTVPFDAPILAGDVETEPILAGRLAGYQREGIRGLLVVPLWIHGQAAGSLAFYYRTPRRFATIEVQLATALANIAAAAIGNAELYAEQQQLRVAAEQAQRRLAFLAEASNVLATTLEYETTLQNLARLTVPELADWAVIDLVRADGQLELLAVAHRDPDRVALARQFRERYPPEPDAPSGILTALRSGKPALVAEINDAMLAGVARDVEHLTLMRRLALGSVLYLPLVIRGQPVGVLTLCMAESDRHYGPPDIALAEEVARRAGLAIENARLYAAAQAAIQLREEFLSIASHELKTPLTGLQLQVQMLLRLAQQGGLAALPAERMIGLLERVEHQTKRLGKLINSLLDLSRLQAGRLELELADVDLVEVTKQVVELFQPELTAAGSRLVLHAAAPVIGHWDRDRVDQVISNLLANAIKYGRGRPIEISVGQEGATATLAVCDEGIGIAPEHQGRIFERYERAVGSRHYSGFGLGLYIARQIVEELGGSITVSSRPGVGATFQVALPMGGPDQS